MIPLYILAGGLSSRFGTDKARALSDGVPLVLRVAESLAVATRSTTVVAASPNAYSDLGLRTIGDIEAGLGPMGGLVTALVDADGPVFLAACDLREPRAEWAAPLLEADETTAYRTEKRWEPLFARYELSVLPTARRLLSGGERSMQALLNEVGAALPAPSGWPLESSFNRPDDL